MWFDLKRYSGDSNNIILWHESEDITKNKKTKQNKNKKKAYFQNLSWFQFCISKFKSMIMCVSLLP